MKTQRFNLKLILALILIFFFVLNCDKSSDDEVVETRVSGRVFDYYTDLPFSDYKIKIAEYRLTSGIGPSSFEKFIDSAYTDSDGYYDFSFKSSGNSNIYKIQVDEIESIWTIYFGALEVHRDSIGKSYSKDLNFIQFYPVNLKITLNNVESLPVKMNVSLSNSRPNDLEINGIELERTVYLSQFSSENKISFRRRIINNVTESFQVQLPGSSPTEIIDFPITINDSDFE